MDEEASDTPGFDNSSKMSFQVIFFLSLSLSLIHFILFNSAEP